MNDRIRMQKEYQEQLEILLDGIWTRAEQMENELRSNVPDAFYVAVQHNLFVIKPLHAIVFFVCVLKNIGWYMDQLEDVNEKRFRLGDAFDVLKNMPSETAEVILNTIECNEAVYDMAIEALESNDKDSFVSTLKQLTGLKKFYRICKFFYDLTSIEGLAEEEDDDTEALLNVMKANQNDVAVKMGIDNDDDYCRLVKAKDALSALVSEGKEDLEEVAKALNRINAEAMYIFVEAYQQNQDTFTTKEKALVENIIYNPEHPEIRDWYEKNLAIYKKNNGIEEQEEEVVETVEEFHLPENFSRMLISRNFDEHFTGTSTQLLQGEHLEELLSYMVQNNYIDNNPDIMRLFVYRLTGKWRPEMKELPQISWNGGIDASANELIYIVQKATDGHQKPGKYDKMKMYFTGPKFPDNPKSVADNAKIEFRRYLVRLYPNIFKLRPTESEK